MNKLEQISTIMSLFDEQVLSTEETITKVKLVLGKTETVTLKGLIKKVKETPRRPRKRKNERFTAEEDIYITSYYDKMGKTAIAKKLGRTRDSIYTRWHSTLKYKKTSGKRKYRKMTSEEKTYIKINLNKKPLHQIAKDLKRPFSTVNYVAKQL